MEEFIALKNDNPFKDIKDISPISHGVFDRDNIMGGGLKDPQPKTGLSLVRLS